MGRAGTDLARVSPGAAAQHKRREQDETPGVGGDPGLGTVLDRRLHCAIHPFAPSGKGAVSPLALK